VQNIVLVAESDVIGIHDLPAELREGVESQSSVQSLGTLNGLSLDQIEKHAIRSALKQTGGNREQAAKMLGIGERTLYRKLKEYGLR